jgi:cytochrome c-type biogenesis protein CcmF
MMAPELGQFALVLAFVVALAQSIVPLVGAARGNSRWMAFGASAAIGQCGLIALAFATLAYSHIVSDFTVVNVVENSFAAMPLLYKITGVWGNHEGSMLLWVMILAFYGMLIAVFGNNLPSGLKARVLAVQGMIGLGFLAFILATSNPFARVYDPPPDGQGLNPLLQDPGLAFHPPFLYLGYVGFSVAFAFAVAALIEGRVDPAWARWVRPWTLAAWSALTLGVAMGSWWAYYTLGWGGWWGWDPVENASLMPWLAGTALLHSAIVVEKRDALKSWTILLAILTFSLSLIGTFLVRSGLTTSVHSFALDPARGIFVLGLLGVATGGALTLYAIRAPALKLGGLFQPISREGGLVLNNLLLSTMCATVFIGTLYPTFLNALTGRTVSVGPPFFNATFLPLSIPLIAALGVGPMLSWKRSDLLGALGRLKFAALAALVVALATYYLKHGGPILAVPGMAGAVWLVGSAFAEVAERVRLGHVPLSHSFARAAALPRAAWGMTLAHAGLGVMVAGMTGTALWTVERIQAMHPGDQVELAGYEVRLDGVGPVEGPNYDAQRASLTVSRDGKIVTVLTPERRIVHPQEQAVTNIGIHTDFFADIYAVLGDPDPAQPGAYVTRLYHHPLVPWIWVGAVVMVFGGLLSLSDRRLRVGAPSRRPFIMPGSTASAE